MRKPSIMPAGPPPTMQQRVFTSLSMPTSYGFNPGFFEGLAVSLIETSAGYRR
jgi:hypothetical protein